MSHPPSPTPLTDLPLTELSRRATDLDPRDTKPPKAWFEQARYEAEKATLAERRGKKEEMYVQYVRACQSYANCKSHPDFPQERDRDVQWAARVKQFKETYEAFLIKAKNLKEVLRAKSIESNGQPSSSTSASSSANANGKASPSLQPTRPSASRQSTGGPEVKPLGSIADRMKALSGKGMDVGSSSKRFSKDLSGAPPITPATPGTPAQPPASAHVERANGHAPQSKAEDLSAYRENDGNRGGRGAMGGTSITGGAGTYGVARRAGQVNGHSEPEAEKKPSPQHTGGSERNIVGQQPQPIETSTSQKQLSPVNSGESGYQSASEQLPSVPHMPAPPPTRPLGPRSPDTPHPPKQSSLPNPHDRPSLPLPPPQANGHEVPPDLNDFDKLFPSMSEFNKQYEEPFERDPDSEEPIHGMPNVKSTPNETGSSDTRRQGGYDEAPELNLPDVSGLPDLPNLPSVPSNKPGLSAPPPRPDDLKDGLGPPSPDMNADLKRPASTPNVTTLTDDRFHEPSEGDKYEAQQPKTSHPPPPPVPRNTLPTVPNGQPLAFPVAKPTPPPAPVPAQSSGSGEEKPKYPISNFVECETLRGYILNPAAEILILDIRQEEESKRGYVGVEYEGRPGVVLNYTSIDPTVLMRDGMTSAKLEDALSLSPEKQRKAFENRHKYDLVVVYDSQSSNWPRKDSSTPPTPLARLWEVIYEHEFSKRLSRTPVLLIGGYAGWVEFIKKRGAMHAKNFAQMQAKQRVANGQPSSRERAGSASSTDAKRSNRDVPVYQSSQYAKNITDGFGYGPQSMTGESSYTGRHQSSSSRSYASPPPSSYVPSRHGHTSSNSLSSYQAQSPIAPPPQASIHPGPGARRRSDYVDHSTQAYSGYSPRGAIDYPQAHALVQPPPAAQGHVSERYERPTVVRSGSIRGLDQVARDGDEVRYWNDVVLGLTGLKNLGNTCYMNSTLQCLSATYPFTSYFLDGSFKRSINVHNPLGMKGNLANAFAELLKALWKEDYTFLSPVTFRKNIISFASQFSGTEQHDSQEFLSFVLDGLHEDLNRIKHKPPPVDMTPEREAALETLPAEVASEKEWQIYKQRNDSFIVDLFQGQYRNRLECLTCHKTSTTYDTFMYLSLPVPSNKHKVVVQELIDEFVKAELLDKEDAWNCPRCKVPRRATKTLTISRLPPVLLIQLKRFTTQNGVFWDKSETPVIFPVNGLDLSRYLPYRQPTGKEDLDDPRTQIGPYRYDLYGVSNHMGTLSSGHYTAYVKSSKGWQYCEDSRVNKAQEKDVVSRPAYILFYKRVKV